MSGLEVVGITLAIFPLIISGLEHYQHGRDTLALFRGYAKELKMMTLKLATEYERFQNTCEKLLAGIVPAVDLEDMIKNPSGMWDGELTAQRLQRRLHRSFSAFQQTTKMMQEAIMELKEELGIELNEPDVPKEKSVLKREVKRITLVFKRPKYQGILKMLSDGNDSLGKLLSSNLELEPRRREGSQGRILNVLQTVTRSIYNALGSSISCSYSSLHLVNFELFVPPLASRVGNEEALIKKLDFRITLSFDPKDLKGKRKTPWVWDEIALRMAELPQKADSSTKAMSTTPSKGSKSAKSVKFSEDRFIEPRLPLSSIAGSQMNPMDRLILPPANRDSNGTPDPLDLVDLCDALAKNRTRTGQCCYGYVTDDSATKYRKFGVYLLNCCHDSDGWSTVSLKELLQSQDINLFVGEDSKLSNQLHIATTIAASILHLYGTQWLPKTLTSENVYFMKRHGILEYNRVYVSKRLSDAAPQGSPASRPVAFVKNQTLFCLGILLIELLLCQTLDDLCHEIDPAIDAFRPSLLFKPTFLAQLEFRMQYAATDPIKQVVDHCLKCNFICVNPSLNDSEFRQAAYRSIVAPLQDNYEMSQALREEIEELER
ncbi:hypothetical protein DL764_000135 [Monosporascus ibericus]|uniref:DUF7580 domain-containing protein n=1 Tax=Monosporascus ibericus TaxID=155417 RepID=A0A4Q4TY99_9PEZI|nr:hypothetical protein DL764_000135 [Monosporascus ibericus]